MFMTPGLPFVPAIAVTVNIYLIFKLSVLTLVRFTIWMTIGEFNRIFLIVSAMIVHVIEFTISLSHYKILINSLALKSENYEIQSVK